MKCGEVDDKFDKQQCGGREVQALEPGSKFAEHHRRCHRRGSIALFILHRF